jgi:type I restriction-modification system DNA methylase subunit
VNAQSLVAKVWNFAHVLRDQGVSYQAYISQISYLLFLKMDEERVTQIGEASMLPAGARPRRLFSALKNKFSGVDIVPEVERLAAMNLYLHGITGVDSIVEAKDALLGAGGKTYEVILTNPPFGKKQSYRIVRDDGEIDSEREDYDRQDFFVTTSNK